ncbi:MAG: lysoplasmalogenase [Sediminibacterium sp.]
MNLRKLAASIYILVLLVHCYLLWVEQSETARITKILLMPLLLLYLSEVMAPTKIKSVLPKKLIALAFLASWGGDIFLLYTGNLFFIAGMLCFIVAHFCYIILFIKIQPLKINNAFLPILGGIVVLIIGAIIINHLAPKLGDLYAPVVVYMIVIATMFSSAIMISSNTNTKRYGVNYFVPGAALFVLSDSVLSLNIFAYKNVFLGVVVMFTYGFAQFFLAKGFRNYLMNK